MAVRCGQVIDWMEEWAPRRMAEKWDNVGLLVGAPYREVERVLVALEVTRAVIDEALEQGAQLIITHHPLFLEPIKVLREDTHPAALVNRLIKSGLCLYAAHTNLDVAPGGVNDLLAGLLGLSDTSPLSETGERVLYKVAVFVPVGHEEEVRRALCEAGAGWIGRYSDCAFESQGIGTFRPLEGTNPYIGEIGKLERVSEVRLETVIPGERLDQALRAMLAAHPYEEAAYDIYRLQNRLPGYGLGRVGFLPHPCTLAEFAGMVKERLGVAAVRLAGNPDRRVKKVALCGGSGMSLVSRALRSGADVYLTSDVKHHDALDALAQGLAVVDAGHYGTEQVVVPAVTRYLRERAEQAGEQLQVTATGVVTDPFRYL